jgi:hypothetical protein
MQQLNPKLIKINLLSASTNKTQKQLYFSALFYFLALAYFLAFLLSVILFYFTNTEALCLTTTRWSWEHKTKNLFCTLLDKA